MSDGLGVVSADCAEVMCGALEYAPPSLSLSLALARWPRPVPRSGFQSGPSLWNWTQRAGRE